MKPFLHPSRAQEIAYSAQNPYSEFHCHETTVNSEEDDGERVVTDRSLMCAGFLTLMANEVGESRLPEGFEPSYDLIYTDFWEMVDAYEEEYNKE